VPERGYGDVLGGGLLVALGAFGAIYTYSYYQLGTPSRMGPGMVPMLLSILLVGLGSAISIKAMLTHEEPLHVDFKAAGIISLSVGLFAILVDRVGAVPAIFVLVLVSFMAGNQGTFRGIIVTASILCMIVAIVFVYGLRMPIDMFRQPF